ncbi:hypothetical protein [Streptomyces sp. NRRL S-337]|nr:hypothetical protein [Streptomyces sp. NRRL S-337]
MPPHGGLDGGLRTAEHATGGGGGHAVRLGIRARVLVGWVQG